MTETLLFQIIGALLLVTIVIIVIIIVGELSMRDEVKRKSGSAERLRRIWEEERERERQERGRLKTLFSKIENQISCEQIQEKSAGSIVTVPNAKLFSAPGQNIQEFLEMITVELSRKRTEYLIVGLLNETNSPCYMLELKGRSIWVSYDAETILDKAAEVNAAGIMCIHNHPVPSGFSPALEPSEEDISSGYSFYVKCKKRGFNFLGDFIVSKGCYEEFLIPLMRKAWDDVSDSTTEKEEQKQKEEREKEFQIANDAPVFLFLRDEIPQSFAEFKSVSRNDYKKWTFSNIAEYAERNFEVVYQLIVQDRTPIKKRVDSRGQCAWLVRKRDFDAWIEEYRKSQEI